MYIYTRSYTYPVHQPKYTCTHTHHHPLTHNTTGANAYMLMYRRVDPTRNAPFPTDEEVPPHVRASVEKVSTVLFLCAICMYKYIYMWV